MNVPRLDWRQWRTVVAIAAILGLAGFSAGYLVRTGAAGPLALLATLGLPGSAFAMLILHSRSAFIRGYAVSSWLYFIVVPWLLIGPLAVLSPTAWTTVKAYYRADQYWPPDTLQNEVTFARGDWLGDGQYQAAHLLWTGVSGLVGGLACAAWRPRRSAEAVTKPAGPTAAAPTAVSFGEKDIVVYGGLLVLALIMAFARDVWLWSIPLIVFMVATAFAGVADAAAFMALCLFGGVIAYFAFLA